MPVATEASVGSPQPEGVAAADDGQISVTSLMDSSSSDEDEQFDGGDSDSESILLDILNAEENEGAVDIGGSNKPSRYDRTL